MNVFRKLACRAVQKVIYLGSFAVNWNRNEATLSGKGAFEGLAVLLAEKGLKRVLLVMGATMLRLNVAKPFVDKACKCGIETVVYSGAKPDPTLDNVEEGVKLYRERACDCIVALGGGSSMDCAKGIGACIARPDKSVSQMKGVFKVNRKLPPLAAVPTTAGSGSEATIAAVLSNKATHEKYPISDTELIPKYVALDPALTVTLPPHVTAQTGMDALTHAVESFIGKSNTKQTEADAVEAVKLIHKSLYKAYSDGGDLVARNDMQKAAYLAGKAFTRAYVGYVHAIAHTLGGFYGVPHGLANAVLLPVVLTAYGRGAEKRLSRLATVIGISKGNDRDNAAAFIDYIRDLNAKMGIPEKLVDGSGNPTVQEKDICEMSRRADREANPLYPCPVLMNALDLSCIYKKLT